MKVFYNKSYKLHYGLNSSFECPERIEQIIKNINIVCSEVTDKDICFNVPCEWRHILHNLEEKYKNK